MKWFRIIGLVFLTVSLPLKLCLAADSLIALDILLEPDGIMLAQATTDNARLRENYPSGFALDRTHHPHISVLQCFVKAGDIDKVFAAVKQVVDSQKPAGMQLKTTGYFYAPWQGPGLAGVTVEVSPELLAYQSSIVKALQPFVAKNGTAAAFVPNEDGTPIGEAIIDYVNVFIPQHTGKNYGPHVTIGLGTEDFLKGMVAAPYTPFTFRVARAGVYQLGDFGTARKKLWAPAEA